MLGETYTWKQKNCRDEPQTAQSQVPSSISIFNRRGVDCGYEESVERSCGRLSDFIINTMSNQFFHRVINYVANEIIVKGLANSKTFQRVAVRTDHHMREFQKTGQEHIEKTVHNLSKQADQTASSTAGRPSPPLTGLPGFVSAFFKEIRKDFGANK